MFTVVLICSTFLAFVVAPCAIGLHIRASLHHADRPRQAQLFVRK